jgi:luciferase family oxidoreductase group 1
VQLSILDQSPVLGALGARRAIEETIALARRADELGYHRYWLAEHHAIAALADPCPEVLVARIGAETRRIRVGTGGVLLPYYSAFRTAESFRMLEALRAETEEG